MHHFLWVGFVRPQLSAVATSVVTGIWYLGRKSLQFHALSLTKALTNRLILQKIVSELPLAVSRKGVTERSFCLSLRPKPR